ncbi:Major Facilitator Superfamily protein [Candidatus Rubidus massiliensis]|nr:MAG: hypothetical protein BGO10_07865 [Chlamydia sp. 32-24]CDZ79690.1 Major Facilitator Superfamily protein [Candidatus Rubidus massiliensis]
MENYKKTYTGFVISNVFNAPLWAMYSLLVFIFYKDLHATPLQLTLLISIKPAIAILSFYWSSIIHKRPDLLKKNIFWATVVGFFPCFLFPFFENIWFYILAYGLYMMAIRAVIPAWMEILKINVPASERSKVFSHGSSINYLTGLALPIFVGHWMDVTPGIWRWMFPIAAICNSVSLFLLMSIPLEQNALKAEKDEDFSLKKAIVAPWKNFYVLMKTRIDFTHFQIIFMLGGLSIMVMQPALPNFFIETLHLSYTELAIAITICKGLGFAATSRLWANLMNKVNLYAISSLVTLFAAFFPILLIFAEGNWIWFYMAYLIYGIMQAGSEMSWNLSGPIFSKQEDSTQYSGVNVMLVGLRGCVGPSIGGLLCALTNCQLPLLVGCTTSIIASLYALYCSKKFTTEPLYQTKN